MPERDWNQHYLLGETPWDTNLPDEHLVSIVERGMVRPSKTFEIGCGTGTNAIWLADHGFEVFGVDFAPPAVERARAKAGARKDLRFEQMDFLKDPLPKQRFGFVFDRGVFHVFDAAETQARFASRVAELLDKDVLWVSLLGSTEGAPRDRGPPRRSARDIMIAVEPSLEIVELRSIEFRDGPEPVMAWVLASRRRKMPAQPSTR